MIKLKLLHGKNPVSNIMNTIRVIKFASKYLEIHLKWWQKIVLLFEKSEKC